MKREDVESLLIIGAALGAVALVWKFYTDAKKAAGAILSAPGEFGNAIGTTLFDWGNHDTVGESTFYTVTFQDASRHAVPAGTVAGDGSFTYAGNSYVLKTDKLGNRYAVGTSVAVPG